MPVTPLNNEKEILRRLAAGEEPAFRLVYDHYRNKIYTMAFKVTGSEATAHDVIQEIFVKLWVNKAQLADLENFNAYLNTVIRHHLSNRFRKLAIESTYVKYLMEGKGEQVKEKVTDSILYNEINRLHLEAIERLSPQQRRVYIMGKQHGLRYDEIALQMNISKDTVKEYMSDAMHSVRQYLKMHEYELIMIGICCSVHGMS